MNKSNRSQLELYMMVLNNAMGKKLSTNRLASYSGMNLAVCKSYLLSMEKQGLIVGYRDSNKCVWNTTLEGRQLAIDIKVLFKRAGIELRSK